MAAQNILTGASLVCYINGNLIGEVNSFNFRADYGRKMITGIDSLICFEIVPGPLKVSGTVSMFRLRGTAGLEGRGAVARFKDLTREKYINITIIDRVLDMAVFSCEQAVVDSQDWTMSSKNIVNGSFSFEGFQFDNELYNLQQ